MKTVVFVFTAALYLLPGCSPSDTYKPAEERQYESADSSTHESTSAPSDSTSTSEEEGDDKTEEVILRSL